MIGTFLLTVPTYLLIPTYLYLSLPTHLAKDEGCKRSDTCEHHFDVMIPTTCINARHLRTAERGRVRSF